MTAILQAQALGKRYGQRQALADCTLEIPPGHVVGLVGPNGAGKTTLLKIACGMLAPTTGRIEVLGEQPAAGPAQLARVGYVAQDTPIYASLSVADHLTLGAKLNPRWDADARAGADRRSSSLDRKQKAGKLSGGQRAQLALTVAVAKRPELLILDEPVASLDPLARRDFLRHLMESVAENDTSVILSSHLVSDLERVCDYLIVLVSSRVQLAGETDDLLAQHHRLVCTRRSDTDLPAGARGDLGRAHRPAVHVHRAQPDRATARGLVRRTPRPRRPRPDLHGTRRRPGRRLRYSHDGGRAMIWLTWRQFRAQALTALALLAAAAIYFLVTGLQMHHTYTADLAVLHPAEQLRRRARPVPGQLQRRVPSHPTPRDRRPGADRHLLGRATDRPGTGDRHPPVRVEPDRDPHPLARGQTHRRRPRVDRHRRAPQLPDHLVGRDRSTTSTATGSRP